MTSALSIPVPTSLYRSTQDASASDVDGAGSVGVSDTSRSGSA